MNRFRNWIRASLPALVAALVLGSLAFAAPALADPDGRGGHRYRGDDDDGRRYHHVERLRAERDAAWAEVEQLRRQLEHRPSRRDWEDAQRQIATLEQELTRIKTVGGRRLFQRISRLENQLAQSEAQRVATENELAVVSRREEHRRQQVERLERELEVSRVRIARLERRLYRFGRYSSYGGGHHRAVVYDD